jgi:hypothetical protein
MAGSRGRTWGGREESQSQIVNVIFLVVCKAFIEEP